VAASHKPPCQSHKARYLLYFCVCVLGLICNPPSFSSPEEIERNRNEAVIKLQTLWRGHRESQRFDCLLTAVVVTPSSTPPISLPPGRTRANNLFSLSRDCRPRSEPVSLLVSSPLSVNLLCSFKEDGGQCCKRGSAGKPIST